MENSSPSPLAVPGGVYLCQVNEKVSCGACCGLYNVAGVSRKTLTAMLRHRSERFQNAPRTIAAIDDFAARTQSTESQKRPFPQFHHCPFIGLIGRHHQRVGCLLHPMAQGNDGVDYRGLSYYGGLACRTYFCPSTHRLPARYKRILRVVIDDWYAYGLIVTEQDLLSALFGRMEALLGRPLVPALFEQNPNAVRGLKDLLELKIHWPYRPPQADTPCHHFFFDVEYAKPVIDYAAIGVNPSPYNDILIELVSGFERVADLTDAQRRIEIALQTAVSAIDSAS